MAAEGERRNRTIDRLRERKERHKQRSRLYRVLVALGGVLLIVLGLSLSLPGVPGPGLVIVAVGLGLLALEFDRAERVLARLLKRIDDAAERAERASPLQRTLGVVAIVAAFAGVVAAFVLWDVPLLPG